MVTGNLYGTNLPTREPDQRCEACDATGTVGRATRFEHDGRVREMHRFCRACWPEQYARYRARWAEEDRKLTEEFFRKREKGGHAGYAASYEAATWHLVLEQLQELQLLMTPRPTPSADDLARLAAQWAALAAQIEEPMPLELQWFIQAHTPRE
jgi:hypothetical protein